MPNPTDQRIIELTRENAELKLIIQHLLRRGCSASVCILNLSPPNPLTPP